MARGCESEPTAGRDADGGTCWEVVIDGVLYQDRSMKNIRRLMAAHLSQKPTPNPSARWAPLESIEGLCYCKNNAGCGRCQIQTEPSDP